MKLKKVSAKPVLKPVKKGSTINTPPKEEKSIFKSHSTSETQVKSKYNNLREVMDLNRNFSMMYSGVEDDNNFQILYDMGIRNFLISFHYVQKKHLNVARYEEMGIKFFVDSGAYSFISNLEFQDYTVEQWEKYIESYLRWIEKHSTIVFAFANLDLEYLVGGDKVQEWNEKYFEPFMLRTGIPVCFVYHDNATKFTWEQYCQRYPYVGISWGGLDTQGNDIGYGTAKLKVAEKYGAVCHGMAMTQTALLTKLPFYTVDSTTWLVGLQYGEINFWTGQKMSRLKKDKWKGSMLSQVVSKGFDEQKLLDEDKEEMIKVNVHAFIEAEQFVQDRLKSRMYWLRPDKVERTESGLNSIEYPPVEWLENASTDGENWEEYAKTFNITTADRGLAIDNIIDLTIFMNWYSDDYAEFRDRVYKPELIKDLHDTWVNRIVSSEEERVEDLIDFFKECLMGKSDKLLVLGTNFDRLVKERDSYVDDTEYDYEDVSDMEISNLGAKYLPAPKEGSPAPEIDDLDDEIFRENEIIPVRDEKGHFLKGQRKVARPKKMYSNKYPKMACDTCINAQSCPEYKAGYVCAYNKMFERYNTRDMGDIVQAMQGIADYSLVRLQRAMINETMNGGLPDPAVSNLMTQAMGLMTQMQRLYETGSQEVIRQTKVLRSDGTQETTTQVSNPQAGGILEKIFGDMSSKDDEKEEVIDSAEVVEQKD